MENTSKKLKDVVDEIEYFEEDYDEEAIQSEIDEELSKNDDLIIPEGVHALTGLPNHVFFHSIMTFEDEKYWFARYNNPETKEEAFNYIFEHNLRLVLTVVSKRINVMDQIFQDLFQEGMLGLINAITKFEIEKGWRFSTYAWWWIRQAVNRAYQNTYSSIRLPVHMSEKIYKVEKYILKYAQDNDGEEPSDELIMKNCGISTRLQLRNLKEARAVYNIDSLNRIVTYGNGSGNKDEERELGELVEDTNVSIEDSIVFNSEVSYVKDVIKECLKPKEYIILNYRFGLEDGETPHTLEEIGQIFKVSRERIRQIEGKALKKVRSRFLKLGMLSPSDYTRLNEKK